MLETLTGFAVVGVAILVGFVLGRIDLLGGQRSRDSANSKDMIDFPGGVLFLAGGNASVRGYGYQQIGVESSAGVTEAGRYLLTGSLEYRRPVWRNGRATDWDSIVFVDAGNVANTPAGLRHLQYGVGAGAIWRSPVGPVELAAAYGVQERKLRLHMNLGFTF